MRARALVILVATACSSQTLTAPGPAEAQNAAVVPAARDENAEPEGSITVFPKAKKEAQAKSKELIEQGRAILKTKGKAGALEAAALFSEATHEDPRNAMAYWELGWAQQITNDFDAALATWQTLKQLDPKFPDLDNFTTIATARKDQPQVVAAPSEPPLLASPNRKKALPRKADAKPDR